MKESTDLCPNRIKRRRGSGLTALGLEHIESLGYSSAVDFLANASDAEKAEISSPMYTQSQYLEYGTVVTPGQFARLLRNKMKAKGIYKKY